MKKFRSPALLTLALAAALANVSNLFAHEYYLEPDNYSPAIGETIAVRHKLGEKFKGNELPWVTPWNIRSEFWVKEKKTQLRGLDGDRPALTIPAQQEGLLTVIHQSNIDYLTFSSYEKFEKYTRKEGLEHALAESESGKKPKEGLKEAYSRFAKTLIAVGNSSTGKDAPTGLKIELVALSHPLELKADMPMKVQLLFDGEPLAGAAVKAFEGIGQEFAYHVRSDNRGIAEIKPAGPGPYLINAIHMVEPVSAEAINKQAHWESFWASLTFMRRH